jgi:putative superfamily III holin-X
MANGVDEPVADEAVAVAEDAPLEHKAEEAEAAEADKGEEAEDAEDAEPDTSELLEKVGRSASTLVLREVQLTTSQHIPELARAARDLTAVVAVVVAFITAFALANWAIVEALSPSLPGWRAPLVLMAIWVGVGLLLAFLLLIRTGRLTGWRWWKGITSDPDEAVRNREQARDDAEAALRESLKEFAAAVARDAGVLVTAAIVPIGGNAAEAGEKVIDAVDDVTDAIEDKVPGGGVINKMATLALKPGRYALGALKRDDSDSDDGEPADDEPAK